MKDHITGSINLGIKSNFSRISIKLTKQHLGLSKYLFQNGFLDSYFINKSTNTILIYFTSYYDKKPISNIKKISSPGKKVYITYQLLKKTLCYKNSYLILSTNRGFCSNKEAVSFKIGGELLYVLEC